MTLSIFFYLWLSATPTLIILILAISYSYKQTTVRFDNFLWTKQKKRISENILFRHKGLKKLIQNHIFSSTLRKIDLTKKCVINTINPHSFFVSKKDSKFYKALINSDVLLPDGTGIVLAHKLLFGSKIKKIAGSDIHLHLLHYANEDKKKVFYMGASKKTLKIIKKKINKDFPFVKVGNYSPPFKSEFTDIDNKIMIERINSFNPDILFVGMTAPKQEKWVEENKEYIDATVITSIGAVFDFYSGRVKRSSKFWIKLGLEWLPRFLKEPRRLWRRNLISTPYFLLCLFRAKFIEKLLEIKNAYKYI